VAAPLGPASPHRTFTIRGVPAGPYTLQGFMDTLGKGSATRRTHRAVPTICWFSPTPRGSQLPWPILRVALGAVQAVLGESLQHRGTGLINPITNSSGTEMQRPTRSVEYYVSIHHDCRKQDVLRDRNTPECMVGERPHQRQRLLFPCLRTSAGTAPAPIHRSLVRSRSEAPTGGNTVSGR